MNPVWKRELRARWRGWRAFALVFFYVAVLAAGFLLQYRDSTFRTFDFQPFADPRRRMALMGHDLFVLMSWLQVVLWMLLAPLLTATAITTERQQGLLEGLHLSRLRAGEIVMGKLLSALSLVALLILITLPITASSFLMGGVSPGEFLLVVALHAATAVCGAAIGLAVSAWCKNGMAAIALTFVAMIVCNGLAVLAYVGAFTGFTTPPAIPPWPWSQLLGLASKAHPLVAALQLTVTQYPMARPAGIPTTPSWIVSLVFLFAFSLLCLWLASKGTRRILGNGKRIELQTLRRELKTPDATNLRAAPDVAAASAPDAVTRSAPTPATKRFELGLLARWQFSNPVLGREVRSCFRPRSTSLAMLILAGVLLPLAALAYVQGIYWAVCDGKMRLVIGPSLLLIHLMLTIGLCAVLGAGGLAREREAGTWEALHLSLLSPTEILWGKLGTPLLMSAVCGAAVLPVLVPCVRSMEYSGNKMDGIALSQVIGALLIIVATAWCCALLGLLASHYSKKPVTSICWTLGVLFVVLLVAPLFLSQIGGRENQRAFEWWLMHRHPVLTVFNLFDRQMLHDSEGNPLAYASTLAIAFRCALGLFITGAVFYCFLLRALHLRQNPGDA